MTNVFTIISMVAAGFFGLVGSRHPHIATHADVVEACFILLIVVQGATITIIDEIRKKR